MLDRYACFRSLKGERISEKYYLHATDVWIMLRINNMIIDICLKYYGLDPCHYFSSPLLSWDSMLKKTRMKLELISNINI